ncbi:NupC/NupG family nucleoside CNT transporter, partial [Staphylococcus pseudintermedius]
MYLIINIIGLFVFLGVAFLFSRDRKNIQWASIATLVVLNLILAWFFVYFPAGTLFVKKAAEGISWVIDAAFTG